MPWTGIVRSCGISKGAISRWSATLRQRLFAWALDHCGGRLEAYLEGHKSQLLQNVSGILVEIGPGVGTNLRYFPPSVFWIGVEPNRFMHRRLREEAMRVGINANLVAGTAENLPFSDRSADAVISTLVLCSVADQRLALNEVVRVLKPGGKFLFIEHVAATRGTWLRRTQTWLKPFWRQMADGCSPDRETVIEVQRANFRHCKVENFTAPFPIVSPHIAGIAVKAED